jgi:two-component system chemotaxis response regulator CheY
VLTNIESKVVLSTLTQRRAWIKKALEENKLDQDARKEHSATLQVLESAMRKLASSPQKGTQSGNASKADNQAARKKPITLEDTHVLVADDQAEIVELIVQILNDTGITKVKTAEDGRAAFDLIKSASPPFDIILCDWEMPELDGLEVLEKAKASNTLGNSLFWMVTANTDPSKIKEAASRGIHDYLAKPVDHDTLEQKLKAAIVKLGGSLEG